MTFDIADATDPAEVTEATTVFINGKLVAHFELSASHPYDVVHVTVPEAPHYDYALCGRITVRAEDGHNETHVLDDGATLLDPSGRHLEALAMDGFNTFYLGERGGDSGTPGASRPAPYQRVQYSRILKILRRALLGLDAGEVDVFVEFGDRDFDAYFRQAQRLVEGQRRGGPGILGVSPLQHEQPGRPGFENDVGPNRRHRGIIANLLDPVGPSGCRAEDLEHGSHIRCEPLHPGKFRASDQGIRVADLGARGLHAEIGPIIGAGRTHGASRARRRGCSS